MSIVHSIGVGNGGGGREAKIPPIFYPRDIINIHTCSAGCRVAVYIMFSLPKMELLPTPMHSTNVLCATSFVSSSG